MANLFDSKLRRPGSTSGKRRFLMALKQPSVEVIAFAAAIAMPILTLCWRGLHGNVAPQAVLVLEWPEERRTGATLQLNGVLQKVAVHGPLEYRCDPGAIRVSAAAHGVKPVQQTVFLEPGQKRTVRILWQSLELPRSASNTGLSGEAATIPTNPDTTEERRQPPTTAANVDGAKDRGPSPRARTETLTVPTAGNPPRPKGPGVPADPPAPAQNEAAVAYLPGSLDPNAASRSTIGRATSAPSAVGAGTDGSAPTVMSVSSDKTVVATNDSRSEEAPRLGGRASSPGSSQLARSKLSPVRAIAVVADPELERLLTDAWGLIERGDYEPGMSKLLEARRQNRDDPRADFSLGLIEGLINHDWASAEKRFADCVRRDPENTPSLNNLAVAKLHNRHEAESVKNWQTIVENRAVTAEVVQNLGRIRQLIKEGQLRKNGSLAKSIDNLYTEAAVATSRSAQTKGGFHLMALQLADGRSVGLSNPGSMVDNSPLRTAPEPRMQNPAATRPGMAGLPQTPTPFDPRLRPQAPYQPGTPGYMPATQNMMPPVQNVPPNRNSRARY